MEGSVGMPRLSVSLLWESWCRNWNLQPKLRKQTFSYAKACSIWPSLCGREGFETIRCHQVLMPAAGSAEEDEVRAWLYRYTLSDMEFFSFRKEEWKSHGQWLKVVLWTSAACCWFFFKREKYGMLWTGFLCQILKTRTLTIFCRLFFSPTKKKPSVIVCCFHRLTSDTGKVHAVHYNLQHQPSEQEGSGCFGLFTPAQWTGRKWVFWIVHTSTVNRKEVGVLDCSHQPSEQEGSGCFGLFTPAQWTGRKWVFWIVHTSPVNRKEVGVLDCSHQPREQEGSGCFGLFTPAQWTGRKWVFWIVGALDCSPRSSEQEGSGCFGLFTPAQSVNRKEVGVLDCSHQLSKQEGSWCFGLFTPAQWTGRKWVFWIVLLHGNHCSPCAWEICEQYHHGMMNAGFL